MIWLRVRIWRWHHWLSDFDLKILFQLFICRTKRECGPLSLFLPPFRFSSFFSCSFFPLPLLLFFLSSASLLFVDVLRSNLWQSSLHLLKHYDIYHQSSLLFSVLSPSMLCHTQREREKRTKAHCATHTWEEGCTGERECVTHIQTNKQGSTWKWEQVSERHQTMAPQLNLECCAHTPCYNG